MCAGLIVTFIGVTLGLMASLDLPRQWTTAAIGVALFVAGAAYRMITGGRQPTEDGSR
jgi:hypothetical protein